MSDVKRDAPDFFEIVDWDAFRKSRDPHKCLADFTPGGGEEIHRSFLRYLYSTILEEQRLEKIAKFMEQTAK